MDTYFDIVNERGPDGFPTDRGLDEIERRARESRPSELGEMFARQYEEALERRSDGFLLPYRQPPAAWDNETPTGDDR